VGQKSKPAYFLVTLSTASQYLQGSAVTQTVLGGLAVYVPVAHFGWQ